MFSLSLPPVYCSRSYWRGLRSITSQGLCEILLASRMSRHGSLGLLLCLTLRKGHSLAEVYLLGARYRVIGGGQRRQVPVFRELSDMFALSYVNRRLSEMEEGGPDPRKRPDKGGRREVLMERRCREHQQGCSVARRRPRGQERSARARLLRHGGPPPLQGREHLAALICCSGTGSETPQL